MTRPVVLSWLVGVGAVSIALSTLQAQQAQQKTPRRPARADAGSRTTSTSSGRRAVDASNSRAATPACSSWRTASRSSTRRTRVTARRSSTRSGRSRQSRSRRSSTRTRTATTRAAMPDFPATVDIVTHENTKSNMEKMDAFKATRRGLPKRTYKDRLTLFSGKDDRALSLRRRPHQRRHLHYLPRASHAASRRHVPVEGRAVHRSR